MIFPEDPPPNPSSVNIREGYISAAQLTMNYIFKTHVRNMSLWIKLWWRDISLGNGKCTCTYNNTSTVVKLPSLRPLRAGLTIERSLQGDPPISRSILPSLSSYKGNKKQVHDVQVLIKSYSHKCIVKYFYKTNLLF